MKASLRTMVAALVTLSASVASNSLGAQAPSGKQTSAIQACPLLTDAEAKQLIARGRPMSEKDETPLGGGTSCTYGLGRGQIIVFSGPKAEANLNDLLKNFKKDKEPKHPVWVSVT